MRRIYAAGLAALLLGGCNGRDASGFKVGQEVIAWDSEPGESDVPFISGYPTRLLSLQVGTRLRYLGEGSKSYKARVHVLEGEAEGLTGEIMTDWIRPLD